MQHSVSASQICNQCETEALFSLVFKDQMSHKSVNESWNMVLKICKGLF